MKVRLVTIVEDAEEMNEESEIERLIQNLGHSDFWVNEWTKKELLEIGSPAVELLIHTLPSALPPKLSR